MVVLAVNEPLLRHVYILSRYAVRGDKCPGWKKYVVFTNRVYNLLDNLRMKSSKQRKCFAYIVWQICDGNTYFQEPHD
jgi:hypothetical protein